MTSASKKEVKIVFDVAQNEDGWPPFSTESLWAAKTASRGYEIRSVPFFVNGISMGDVVRCSGRRGGKQQFAEVLQESSNSTLRIVCFNGRRREEIAKWLRKRECSFEYALDQEYMSASIPSTLNAQALLKILVMLSKEGEFEFEFSSVRCADFLPYRASDALVKPE